MRAQFRTRIRVVLGLVVFAALLIVARLYFVQIVRGEDYEQKIDRQFTAASGPFDRGAIYFISKEGTFISAATLASGFLVAVNPQTLTDPEGAFSALTAVASSTVDRESFMAAARKKSQVYIEVAHRLSEAEGKTLAAKKIPGIQVLQERWRQYPGGALAAQTIGIVSYGSGDTLRGQTGLEATYDATLARSGNSLFRNFFAELFSNVGNVLVDAKEAREGDIVTTIEPQIETRLAEDLAKLSKRYSSKESGGIIMDPSTGAIIALATHPSYDANDRKNISPSLLGNPLVEHVYEFGSIMKTLTMAAGLDAGVITPESTYNDTGCITVDQRTICNHDRKARGVVPMQQVLSQSLNLGASWIATELGQEKFREYFTKLFGQKTGIDLPAETAALLGNLSSPRQVEYDNMSFGQGIAVTPIQMIRAQAALANGGTMVEPHIAERIQLDTGISRTLDWGGRVEIFKPKTAREVSVMLTSVADNSLGGGAHRIPTMTFAAKTGTAQLTDGKGGYHSDRYFHSFVGYFPSYAPRFIILLYTNDPQGVQYASETLTNTFMDLTHFLINYYAIPPDRGLVPQGGTPPDGARQ
ncbi:penicillin-binding protein 2 [Candidatus Kaiserbacteria bacterium]|nr:penicillin-binding protein 2 [Candidatus Kaiserbacteria bacterium]